MMRLKDIKQMSNISNFREKDTLISEIEDINNLDDTQEISDTRGKTNTCTKSGKIKVLLRIIIAFISGGGVTTLINKLLALQSQYCPIEIKNSFSDYFLEKSVADTSY